jgi:AcrR family transcriptional regulator
MNMPAKVKVTKEMIIDAAFAVARETGAENINARTVSEKLNCSTQPVMYHFATIEELKRTVYAKADRYHSEYLMKMKSPQKGVMLGIGLNYIRFAIEEPHLFRFLFQSDFFGGTTMLELIDAEELTPVLSAMQGALGISMEQTKKVFLTIFLFAHGYASIIANNSLKYDEELIKSHLEQTYRGAILAVQEEMT